MVVHVDGLRAADPLSDTLAAAIAVVLGEVPGAEPWRGQVLRRAEVFQTALRDGAVETITTAAAVLAGLGEGSTPAGDDYLVGVLHALARGRPPSPRIAPLVASLGRIGETRTTAASAAWLAAAARGEASLVWRALLAALDARDEVAVRSAARAVRDTGHTSGAFSLRGFLDTLAS